MGNKEKTRSEKIGLGKALKIPEFVVLERVGTLRISMTQSWVDHKILETYINVLLIVTAHMAIQQSNTSC